jgi:mycothiol system anti-sigma-R factor
MSCGRPHDTSCDEVLAAVYEYIDGEVDASSRARIQAHLAECGPCLEEYGLDELVKEIVHRSCGHDPVPAHLRARVLATIQLNGGGPAPAAG